MLERVALFGAGAWGTGLAVALARAEPRGAPIVLWARDPAQAEAMRARRENIAYLPGVELPPMVDVTADFERAARCDLHLVATPMAGLRGTLERLAALGARPTLWLCKGLEPVTLALPHGIAAEVLGAGVPSGALSGPSFAAEAARGRPFALVLASADAAFAAAAARRLHGGALRIYTSADVVGVEIGGAAKNVMAIATGISDGLELGLNARAALITRGLAEMARLAAGMGADPQTLMGLAGVGDLILTCTGELSRNRAVGLGLGRGRRLDEVLGSLGHVAEGVRAARSVRELARRHGVEMPITEVVCKVLFDSLAPADALRILLGREGKAESQNPDREE